MDKVASFAERLNEALRIREKPASEVAKECGVDKSALSNWRHGRYEARQTAVFHLARSLNVSEAWLMGYDVPMERTAAPVDMSDFTYAMHGAERDLTDHDKEILLQMAKTLADANRRSR